MFIFCCFATRALKSALLHNKKQPRTNDAAAKVTKFIFCYYAMRALKSVLLHNKKQLLFQLVMVLLQAEKDMVTGLLIK